MLGHMARGEALAGKSALRAADVIQRRLCRLRDERSARAMLRARAAILVFSIVVSRVRRGALLVRPMVVLPVRLVPFLPARGADADGDRCEPAQRNQREQRAGEQQFQGAFHGAECITGLGAALVTNCSPTVVRMAKFRAELGASQDCFRAVVSRRARHTAAGVGARPA